MRKDLEEINIQQESTILRSTDIHLYDLAPHVSSADFFEKMHFSS